MEEWRDVIGAESRYEVSDIGNVRSKSYLKHGCNMHGPFTFWTKVKPLKAAINPSGYIQVSLRLEFGEDRSVTVHRLVAEAFLSNPEGLPQVNHKSGDKIDNRVSNLEWCTAQENVLHSYETGLASNQGEKHPRAVMTEELVRQVRELSAKGMKVTEIAKLIGRKYHTVWKAIGGRNWGFVP